MSKLCLIYNTAPRYREAVFHAIDSEYDCDWYFGEPKTDIKEMDLSLLKRTHYYKTCGNPSKLYWKRSILGLLFKKKYQNFFMLAESRSITDYLFFGLAYFLFPKKHIYIWTHGWYGKERGIIAKLKLWQFKVVTGVFVYGNRAKKLLMDQGIPSSKLFVIHNSLDYDTQKALRDSMLPTNVYKNRFKNNYPTLIFIGRLTKVKKLDMIIGAIAMLREKDEEYNLVFVGDGAERKSLEKQVVDLHLQNNIWFYGACYDEKQNAELVYNADLCVSPGNIGLTAIHSLMFGCPAITHGDFKWQMPEFEAIQSGVTGDFFERDNTENLALAISRWFSTKSDKREEVRRACYKEIDEQWNPSFQMKVIRASLKIK